MDEIALFDRTLSDVEIQQVYQRGGSNLKFQVRSCDDSACSGESFQGPDSTSGTFFTELTNSTNGLSVFDISGVPTNRYFQYQVIYENENSQFTPSLEKVSISASQ